MFDKVKVVLLVFFDIWTVMLAKVQRSMNGNHMWVYVFN